MKLVSTTDYLSSRFGFATAVDMLADAGYDGIDFSAFSDEFYTDAHPESFYTEMRQRAEARGLSFVQAHAPFASSFADEAKTERRFGEIVRAMKHAALLGVSTIVVHPYQHLVYWEEGVPERLFEENMAFYRRLLSYAEEYGISVATENMWRSEGVIIGHSVCSRPEEAIRYVDEIGHPMFGYCLDLGHAALVREDPAVFIRALGRKRLFCMHVHDVDGMHDSHTLPYFGGAFAWDCYQGRYAGAINWDRVMAALAEIGYEGHFTFEADNFFLRLPERNAPDAARFMAATGRVLMDKFFAARDVKGGEAL